MKNLNMAEYFLNSFSSSCDMAYSDDLRKFLTQTRHDSETDFHQTFHTPMANRSSSSADSISPESLGSPLQSEYFNIGRLQTHRPNESPIFNPYNSISNIYKTDFAFNETPTNLRQPIGRKILGRNQTKPVENISIEIPSTDTQKNYELFPSESGFQFSSPPKDNLFANTMSSPMSHTSSNCSLNIQNITTPYNFGQNIPKDGDRTKMCTLCRKNGETPAVYTTHCVKEKQDNKFVVTCPILRRHVCPICNLSGDDAHTITYCPVLKKTNNGKRLPSTTITLKSTRIKSNGRKRY